jgi:hypothetical protein
VIQTGSVVTPAKPATSTIPPDLKVLFSPERPGRLSVVFTVTSAGYVLHAGAMPEDMAIRVELVVGGTYSPLVINGVMQELRHDNNVLPLNTVGRYRLRVIGAQNSGPAVVEGSHMGDWT